MKLCLWGNQATGNIVSSGLQLWRWTVIMEVDCVVCLGMSLLFSCVWWRFLACDKAGGGGELVGARSLGGTGINSPPHCLASGCSAVNTSALKSSLVLKPACWSFLMDLCREGGEGGRGGREGGREEGMGRGWGGEGRMGIVRTGAMSALGESSMRCSVLEQPGLYTLAVYSGTALEQTLHNIY